LAAFAVALKPGSRDADNTVEAPSNPTAGVSPPPCAPRWPRSPARFFFRCGS